MEIFDKTWQWVFATIMGICYQSGYLLRKPNPNPKLTKMRKTTSNHQNIIQNDIRRHFYENQKV